MWLVSAAICFSTSLKNYFYLNINFFFFYNVVLVSAKGAGVP